MAHKHRHVEVERVVFHWPVLQLNLWFFVMWVASATVLGVAATLLNVQNTLGAAVPWEFPYLLSITSLTIVFLAVMFLLLNNRTLTPGFAILGAFILWILWIVGLVATSTDLWGSLGNTYHCSSGAGNVLGSADVTTRLAGLELNNICNSWKAAFSFEIVGIIFFIWMMVMAWQVMQDNY